MNAKQFIKSLNIKKDKRTFRNIVLLPFTIFIRIPLVLLFWIIEWMAEWSDIVYDKLPGWRS